MKISQITPAIGARVTDVHLGEAARDPDLFAQIKSALLKHKVLFFRGQDITRADHHAFASCFGDLESHPVLNSDPQYPGLALIYRSDSRHSYENTYHSDGLWRQNPSMGAVLRCIECPEIGGDTIWVNMVQAYEELPPEIQHKILKLRAKSSIEPSFGAVMAQEDRIHWTGTTRRPSTRWCAPIRKPARRFCTWAASPPTSSNTTRRRTSATASTRHRAPRCC